MPAQPPQQSRHLALDTFTSFGALLVFLRRRAQLRQRELAVAVGYSESHIGRLENDQRLPDVAAVMAQFIPALDLEDEPTIADRLIDLARAAHETPAPTLGEDEVTVPLVIPAEAIEVPSTRSPNAIPQHPTPFLSRSDELAHLARLLESDSRCVTLLGPGGVGKTRLAMEAARRYAPQFAHGAYMVLLAGVASPALILPAIAQTLNLPSPRDGNIAAQLHHYLHDKHLLLVLDNIEHIIEGADVLGDLLLGSPTLRLVVTSRERLQLRGETVLEVEGFAVPHATQASSIALRSNDAVVLFISTARRVRHDFEPTDQDWSYIADICRLSEGFPLAIELAASWVRMLSCAEIAHELAQTWDVLQTTLRDLPSRHRSMRVAFTHSWESLTPSEQRILRNLSVFRGSFTREAVAAVLGVSSTFVLPLLGSLADKSMVKRVSTISSTRYVLHEVVRQYAAEQLAQCPDEATTSRERHARFYLDHLCAHETAIRGAAQHQALIEISGDGDNIRTALDWAVTHLDIALLRRVLPVLLVFIEWRYSAAEGVQIFAKISEGLRAYQRTGSMTAAHNAVLALSLTYTGWCQSYVGRSKDALELLGEANALAQATDDDLVRGDALLFLGFMTGNNGDTSVGRRLLLQCIRAFERCGDEWRVARGLFRLGMLMHQDGEYVNAHHVFTSCLARLNTIGDPRAMSLTLNRLGMSDALLGRHADARRRIQESLLHSSAAHDRRGIASALFYMGSLAQREDYHRSARYFFQESLDLFMQLNERSSIADALAQIGYSAVRVHELSAAKDAFAQAWQIVGDDITTTALGLLVSCAALDLANGQCERAVEALALASAHPVSEQATRDRAATLLHEAETRLTPFQYVTAQARGRVASFAAYVP